MSTLATVAEGLPKRLAAEDVAGLDQLVIKARPALAVLEKYWTDRKVEDALEIAQTASKSIAEISVAVHLMGSGPESAGHRRRAGVHQELPRGVRQLPPAHREKLPDGSYVIK